MTPTLRLRSHAQYGQNIFLLQGIFYFVLYNDDNIIITMAEAAAVKKVVKAKKPAAKPLHPPFAVMIVAAIKALKERGGSSRQAIMKFILANNKIADADKAKVRAKLAIRKLLAAKKLVP
ncbi:unnamed protein product, partial [Meganyctiphanes norvegica]